MKLAKPQLLILAGVFLINSFQSSFAQTIDTAYFLNSNQPLTVKIEGQGWNSNSPISKVEIWTNNSDSVFIDLYWKYCSPAWTAYTPFDTTVNLDLITPSTFNLRISSFKDTNSNVNCNIVDSIELLLFYDVFHNIAALQEHEQGEKQLIKIVNLMGKETDDTPNTLLFYLYSDGTTEKVYNLFD